jgi:alpha-1,3-glucan synthase
MYSCSSECPCRLLHLHHKILLTMRNSWSKMAGSSDHVIHADADSSEKIPRRFPHLHAQGLFNLFGYDSGLPNDFTLDPKTGISTFHLSTEWPTEMQINVWGIGPDGHPDQTFVYGDSDNDSVLDRALPGSLSPTMLNLSVLPPYPHVAYRIELDEAKMRWQLVSEGSRLLQILVFSLLWVLPVLTAVLAIWVYMGAFYKIKFNKIGNPMSSKAGFFAMLKPKRGGFQRLNDDDRHSSHLELGVIKSRHSTQGAPDSAVVAPKKVRRCILIATMEYDIEDWGIKIKIGGLGVMAQLMGKALEGHDLVWVVPCVGGVNYPVDQPANPMLVTVMDQQYEVNVQYHKLRNITYVLLDAPIFRQQSKTEPYPPRMDDLDSAIYYSAWNACIARAAERFPIDIYHINDYHGAAAPLYLLPKTIPCCLSLHNAEFQGLWPMRTKKEQEEICKAFNLSHDIVERYIQFGGVFNLLHAGASYLRVHQGGFGAVGVSNKYGSRSYARYPIFWALKHIGKLPNPDPSDTEPWDEAAEAKQVITVDPAFEAARGDLRKQAQEWANLTVDPSANLFVFVGRWSVQKGVDLIADVFPSVLEKHPDVQLICIGPVIDLYGKFAALKLEAIMKKYPGRVYSKPEFTQLPPYIFSGAEFALIPSRDEPFGLVAVEFGRKGALGVGARVGGLGQMPGWWFTVESTTSKHLIQQFKSAINDALASSIEVRADMRARSAKQRFPVARWVEDLEALHGASIRLHQAGTTSGKASARRSDPTSGLLGPFVVGGAANENANPYGLSSFELEAQGLRDSSHERAAQAASGLGRALSLGKRVGPGHRRPADSNDHLTRVAEAGDDAELEISSEDAEAACRIENVQEALSSLEGRQPGLALRPPTAGLSIGGDHGPRGRAETQSPKFSISAPGTNEALPISPTVGMQSNKRSRYPSSMAGAPTSLLPRDALQTSRRQRSTSLLSLHEVTSGRLDYSLQKVDLDFTDSQGEYYRKFEDLLQQKFTAKSSENTLVIEDFLQTSEKEWGARYRAEKLGGPRSTSATVSDRRHSSPCASSDTRRASSSHRDSAPSISSAYSGSALSDEFLLGENYVRPRILTRWLQIRIFDWPIYCILLALGQIMAANSYQIVLLTGGSGADQTEKLYIIGGIYIVASCLWWAMYRKMSPRFVTSIPFAIYGLGFILVGLAPFIGNIGGRQWARNVATGMYAIASASGSLFFALNFGDEGELLL